MLSLPVLPGFLLFFPHPAAAVLRFAPLEHDGSHQTKIVCLWTLAGEHSLRSLLCERSDVIKTDDNIFVFK